MARCRKCGRDGASRCQSNTSALLPKYHFLHYHYLSNRYILHSISIIVSPYLVSFYILIICCTLSSYFIIIINLISIILYGIFIRAPIHASIRSSLRSHDCSRAKLLNSRFHLGWWGANYILVYSSSAPNFQATVVFLLFNICYHFSLSKFSYSSPHISHDSMVSFVFVFAFSLTASAKTKPPISFSKIFLSNIRKQ